MPIITPNSWRRCLRIASAISAVVTAISLLVRPLIITIIDPCLCRSIIGRSRSYRGFDLDNCLLLCLIIIVGVIKDDYLAIIRRPEDVTIEMRCKVVHADWCGAVEAHGRRWWGEQGPEGGGGGRKMDIFGEDFRSRWRHLFYRGTKNRTHGGLPLFYSCGAGSPGES
jgi:hypothetical protein